MNTPLYLIYFFVSFILLSLHGCVTGQVPSQSEIKTQTKVSQPVLLHEIKVPRPSSIYSYCPDGTPLGAFLSLDRLKKWSCIDISSDGQLLLTGDHISSGFYESKLWKIDDGSLVNTFKLDNFRAPTQFSPDGQYIYGVGIEGMGRYGRPRYGTGYAIWEVESGNLVRAGNWPRFTLSNTFNDDSSIFAIQGGSDLILVHFPSMENIVAIEDVGKGSRVVISKDNNYVAVSSKLDIMWGGTTGVLLWDITNKRLIAHIEYEDKHKYDGLWYQGGEHFAFSLDGKIIATATPTRIDTWNTSNGDMISNIVKRDRSKNSTRVTQSLAFNDDGSKLIDISRFVGEGVSTIDLWDVAERKLLMSFREKGQLPNIFYMLNSMARPWDAMVHPTLGIILIKYDSIYPSEDTPNEMKVSIWRLDDMTKLFRNTANK